MRIEADIRDETVDEVVASEMLTLIKDINKIGKVEKYRKLKEAALVILRHYVTFDEFRMETGLCHHCFSKLKTTERGPVTYLQCENCND